MNKSVLIVTGSDYSPRVYEGFLEAKKLGIHLFLLSDGSFEPQPGIFEKHFTYDLRKTKEVLEYMQSQPVKFDGVTIKTSEWLTPLTALLAKQYGCIGNDPIVAFNCRSKYHMRKQLQKGGVPIPKFQLCRNYEELLNAVKEIGIPCVAKPVGGNASYGTFLIQTKKDLVDLKKKYELSIEYLKKKAIDEDVFAFSQEEMNLMGISDHVDMVTDYLVEEFMEGPEISVDALTQNGKTTIMGIADQIRMKPPYFIQLAEKIPYVCDDTRLQAIKDIVKATHKAMNIENSSSHTEIIFTSTGPKIVEIGCRIGGDNIHDAVLEVTGYNLMFESIMIALEIKREYQKIPQKCHTAMTYILPKSKGKITSIPILEDIKINPNVVEIYNFFKVGDVVAPPPESFDFLGYITVKGSSPEKAWNLLQKTLLSVSFTISKFQK